MDIDAAVQDVFDDRAAELGELFAVLAAIAVLDARVLEDTRRLAYRLQTALDERLVTPRARPPRSDLDVRAGRPSGIGPCRR